MLKKNENGEYVQVLDSPDDADKPKFAFWGGDVEVSINVVSSDKAYKVKLKDRRFIDRKTVNLIKNQGILTTIH